MAFGDLLGGIVTMMRCTRSTAGKFFMLVNLSPLASSNVPNGSPKEKGDI
jgi:hypothetical protein